MTSGICSVYSIRNALYWASSKSKPNGEVSKIKCFSVLIVGGFHNRQLGFIPGGERAVGTKNMAATDQLLLLLFQNTGGFVQFNPFYLAIRWKYFFSSDFCMIYPAFNHNSCVMQVPVVRLTQGLLPSN